MSLSNPNKPITKGDLKQFYDTIRPYMGGLVSSKAGFTPVGTIISVMGTTAPANYLACNGQIVNVADYQELADYFENQFGTKYKFGGSGTTFGIPDLRGEFLRGTGTNSHTDQGNGGDVGAHQDATAVHNLFADNTTKTIGTIRYDNTKLNKVLNPDKEIESKSHRLSFASTETDMGTLAPSMLNVRPTNTSVLYCIATKNFYIDPSHDYSTSEKAIGTWIDSKPIYQKTIQLPLPTSAGSQSLYTNVDVSDIDKYIDCKITGISADNRGYSFPLYHDSTDFKITPFNFGKKSSQEPVFYVFFSSFGIKFVNDANYKLTSLYATIQYTKTTD